jgi:DNA-binding PucR family transcriptional regulator
MAPSGLRLSPEEEQAWAELVRPMAEARAGSTHELAVTLTREVHKRLPIDAQLFDACVGSAESGIADILSRMIEGTDPTGYEAAGPALAYAQDLARFGLPLEVIFQVGHVGQSQIRKDWIERFSALQGDERAVGAMGYCESFTFLWMEALYRQWRESFLAEREVWEESVAAVQLETVRAILRGETANEKLAGRRLRYELAGPQRAFLLWSEEPVVDEDDVLVRARRVGEAVGGSQLLLIPLAGGMVAGWVNTGDTIATDQVRNLLRETDGPPLRVAFGSAQVGLEGFRRSHEEALETRRVARLPGRAGPVHEYRAVALTALTTSDVEQARRFVVDELGTLAARDDATVRIATTLKAYFEELGNAGRVARRLGIHKNTVLYRLQRAEQLLGRPLDERHLELHIALTLARSIGEADGDIDPATDPPPEHRPAWPL